MMITATNTLNQLQKQMDMVGNNLANADTNGYKRREATFSELLVQQVNNQGNVAEEIGRLTPNGIRQGVGAKVGQAQLILEQGSLKSTGRELDFALSSPNQFFKVLAQDGEAHSIRYTRDGAFYASPTGNSEMMIVNGQGFPILDENDNFITVPEDIENFSLQDGGVLNVQLQNGQVATYSLGVVSIERPQFMEQMGGNLLGLPTNLNQLGVTEAEILTNLEGQQRNNIGLQQGYLESSNVDIGKEMTDMLNVHRAYQFQSRSISMADQMMGLINGIR
ncbi:flagellar hook-basal body protein [Rossellomorea sp. BNER]|uniref:flagellar hook-basal body protein n=1 Tax=Rossellomorea sp. BNER TaxID=2962031 RepID=UPI003AF2B5D8